MRNITNPSRRNEVARGVLSSAEDPRKSSVGFLCVIFTRRSFNL